MTAMGAISNRCPCCGGVLPMCEKPHVYLDANTLIYQNRAVRLTPHQAELTEILLRRMPGVVSYDTLLLGLYGAGDGPVDELSTLKVTVCKLRPLLKAAGLSIETHWGRGFSLARMEKAA